MFNLTQQQKQSNLKTTYKNNMYGQIKTHRNTIMHNWYIY